MELRVVGAGLGRTGTNSLQLALQELLGAPCYHMLEVFGHPDHIALWHDAVNGKPPEWETIMHGYRAAVDWPVCAFWRELAELNPDAVILLSTRANASEWWTSADNTIFQAMRGDPGDDNPMMAEHHAMAVDMLEKRFTPKWRDAAEAQRAYDAHNAAVRRDAPAGRLVEWQPGDGWEPLCRALGVHVPNVPFPHVNTTAEFRAMLGIDPPPAQP